MPARVLIFANPIAGRGRGKTVAKSVYSELVKRGYAVETFLSKADSLGRTFGDDVKAAIVIGGDGTLRSVAQWAIDAAAQQCAPTTESCIPYPLLIVPMGTANLMGKHLGLAWEPQHIGRQVAHAMDHHRIARLDVAQTNDGIFLLMAGVGFDAWVVHELDRLRSGPIDYTSYVAPAIKAWTSYEFPKLTVTVDDHCVYRDGPALCLVGNIPEYGTGFPLLPLARPDDQLLDVCVMPCSSRIELMKLALAAASGDHVKQEGVVYCKGKHVTIHSPKPVPVQVDGEPAGTTPVEINLLAGRIPFMVPTE